MSFMRFLLFTVILSINLIGEGRFSVQKESMQDKYKRAFEFQMLYSKLYKSCVNYHIIDDKRFWYCLVDASHSYHYFIVTANNDDSKAQVEDAFDHKDLTEALSKATDEKLRPFYVDISELKFNEEGFSFDYQKQRWNFNESARTVSAITNNVFEKQNTTNTITTNNTESVFRKNYNLYLNNSSGDEVQLTKNGSADSPYGVSLSSPVSQAGYSMVNGTDSGWCDDSGNYQISWKMNITDAPQYTFIKSADGNERPGIMSGTYCFAGDEKLPSSEFYLIDKRNRSIKKLTIPPQLQLYYGCPGLVKFDAHNQRFLIFQYERGFKKFNLFEVKIADGSVKKLFTEEHENGVNLYHFYWQLVNKGTELLFFSERDNWRHIYRFNAMTGAVINQVTKGEWIVRKIVSVDEDKQLILFYASGATKGVNPYPSQLCRVNFDGTGFKVLTPEPFHHQCGIFGRYIVDSYSSTSHPHTTVFRRLSDGKILAKLAEADVSELKELKLSSPETFKSKGEDGETDIYGVIWRPSNFDSTKKYPVIEYIYSGPHTDFADFSFNSFCWETQMLAELGFITVVINGKGTEGRGRLFRDVCYKNLGRAGLPDHIAWLKAVGKRYSYIDMDKIGIYGHSAGGYDCARAILAYPDFYKVCVSSAGVHDFRLDKAVWVEQWMGYPAGKCYEEQSNSNNAEKLQGHLLLMHGEIDDNVPVASTLRFARALQKAEKDFDMMIFPQQRHHIGGKTFLKKRMDFFIRYLHAQ